MTNLRNRSPPQQEKPANVIPCDYAECIAAPELQTMEECDRRPHEQEHLIDLESSTQGSSSFISLYGSGTPSKSSKPSEDMNVSNGGVSGGSADGGKSCCKKVFRVRRSCCCDRISNFFKENVRSPICNVGSHFLFCCGLCAHWQHTSFLGNLTGFLQYGSNIATAHGLWRGQEDIRRDMTAGQENIRRDMNAGQEEMNAGQENIRREMNAMNAEIRRDMKAGQEEMNAGQEDIRRNMKVMKAEIRHDLDEILELLRANASKPDVK